MTPRLRVLLALALGLAVVVGLLLLAHWINVEQYRAIILSTMRRLTGHQVTMGTMSISTGSGLVSLQLDEVVVLASDPADPPILQVERILLGVSPAPLLRSSLKVTSITLIGPQLNLTTRAGSRLLERAHAQAVRSDQELSQSLGLGLTDLAIGQVTVRDGILTILDWDQAVSRTLLLDRIDASIHGLSPARPSPITVSARFQSMPLTIHGQIGPLPESLDFYEMPFLLNLDAKSQGLTSLTNTFPGLPFEARASRAYFTTLVHGSLAAGVQANSWMELDKLTLKSPEPQKAEATTPTETSPPQPLDLAWRQKSTFHLDHTHGGELALQEFFLYLEGIPVMQLTGQLRHNQEWQIALTAKTLGGVGLGSLPDIFRGTLSGKTGVGSLSLSGTWPSPLTLEADLDFANTRILWPPPRVDHQSWFSKQAGIPLRVRASLRQESENTVLDKLEILRPGADSQLVQLSGELWPQTELAIQGRWDPILLADYFPVLQRLPVRGPVEFTATGARTADDSWDLGGTVNASWGQFGPITVRELTTEFHYSAGLLALPIIRGRLGNGLAEGTALLASSDRGHRYEAFLAADGISLERLVTNDPGNRHLLEVQGVFSLSGEARGVLADDLTPASPLSAWFHLEVAPGRILGLDKDRLATKPDRNQAITQEGKEFFYSEARADLRVEDRAWRLQNITIDASGLRLQGEGGMQPGKGRWFDLEVERDWLPGEGYPLHLREIGEELVIIEPESPPTPVNPGQEPPQPG
ncbi:MAG: hypothetical protein HQL57_07110 [Magnetococcales bacterium]|nr:hypothetical protein [Magnetococcales bacterium]